MICTTDINLALDKISARQESITLYCHDPRRAFSPSCHPGTYHSHWGLYWLLTSLQVPCFDLGYPIELFFYLNDRVQPFFYLDVTTLFKLSFIVMLNIALGTVLTVSMSYFVFIITQYSIWKQFNSKTNAIQSYIMGLLSIFVALQFMYRTHYYNNNNPQWIDYLFMQGFIFAWLDLGSECVRFTQKNIHVISQYLRIKLMEPPFVVIDEITETAIRLHWTCENARYVMIQVGQQEHGPFFTCYNQISMLEPDHSYTIRLTSFNEFGFSQNAYPVHVKTLIPYHAVQTLEKNQQVVDLRRLKNRADQKRQELMVKHSGMEKQIRSLGALESKFLNKIMRIETRIKNIEQEHSLQIEEEQKVLIHSLKQRRAVRDSLLAQIEIKSKQIAEHVASKDLLDSLVSKKVVLEQKSVELRQQLNDESRSKMKLLQHLSHAKSSRQ